MTTTAGVWTASGLQSDSDYILRRYIFEKFQCRSAAFIILVVDVFLVTTAIAGSSLLFCITPAMSKFHNSHGHAVITGIVLSFGQCIRRLLLLMDWPICPCCGCVFILYSIPFDSDARPMPVISPVLGSHIPTSKFACRDRLFPLLSCYLTSFLLSV